MAGMPIVARGCGAVQKRGAVAGLFVGELGVGEPGVVLDRCVHVFVADPAAGELLGTRACPLRAVVAVYAPAAAVTEPADPHNIDVDWIAGRSRS
jgi:hypothetical protein